MALYWHFPSKDKLIAAVARSYLGRNANRLGSRRGRVPEPSDGTPAAKCSSGSWAPLML